MLARVYGVSFEELKSFYFVSRLEWIFDENNAWHLQYFHCNITLFDNNWISCVNDESIFHKFVRRRKTEPNSRLQNNRSRAFTTFLRILSIAFDSFSLLVPHLLIWTFLLFLVFFCGCLFNL